VGKNVAVENLLIARHNLFFPTFIFLTSMVFLILYIFSNKKQQKIFTFLILFLVIIDLFRFADKFTPFTPKKYLFPQTGTISYLQKNIGIYRVMSTSSEILPPNFSSVYNLQTIDGYDPLYLSRYAEFIISSERGEPDISGPFGFNRIITPKNYTSSMINLLGVKYILSLSDLQTKNLRKVYQEGQTRVYENSNAIQRIFFVSTVETSLNKSQTIRKMFDLSNNFSTTAIIENYQGQQHFTKGLIQNIAYSANTISFDTQNSGEGFLVLTDNYYPTWHAYIDGKQTKIFLTDYTLRGIAVPQGKHTIVFLDSLF
ncbi:MAG: YfhO family protein, partial [Candidatus Levyibacteriota bacterium]